MTASHDFQRVLDTLSGEIQEHVDNNIPSIRAAVTEQKNNTAAGAGDFEFRPLTEEEKKEFVDSLDAKGKQILAELAGQKN